MYEYRFVTESSAESLSRDVNVAVREGWEFLRLDVSVAAGVGGSREEFMVATLQRQLRTGVTLHPEFEAEESIRPGAPDANFDVGP